MKKVLNKIKKIFASPELIKFDQETFINKKEYMALQSLKIDFIESKTINLNELNFEISIDFDEDLRAFFECEGNINRSILNSPHLKLLKTYLEKGKKFVEKNIEKLDYYKFFLAFNTKGKKINLFNPKEKIKVHYKREDILIKVTKLINLYKSIKKTGYLKGKHRGHPIIVLKEPFIKSRFGVKVEHPSNKYEILSGHHRAAVLCALGEKKVKVIIAKDIMDIK